MVRRTRGASFMADAYVFPGGRVDDEDGEGEAAFAVAAARELAEEANSSSTGGAGAVRALDHAVGRAQALRRALLRRARAASGRWRATTASRRSTRCGRRRPTLLARYARGELKLPPPTIRNLEDLGAARDGRARAGVGARPQRSRRSCPSWCRSATRWRSCCRGIPSMRRCPVKESSSSRHIRWRGRRRASCCPKGDGGDARPRYNEAAWGKPIGASWPWSAASISGSPRIRTCS